MGKTQKRHKKSRSRSRSPVYSRNDGSFKVSRKSTDDFKTTSRDKERYDRRNSEHTHKKSSKHLSSQESSSREKDHHASRAHRYETTISEELPGHRSYSRNRGMINSPDHDKSHRKRNEVKTFHDFEVHKTKLCRIFFSSKELVQHGTKEYYDFWKFLKKYQDFEKKKKPPKANKTEDSGYESFSSNLQIPYNYDKRLSKSFHLKPSNPKDLLNRIPYQDTDNMDDVLTETMVEAFQNILSLYIDFLQREKFAKLKKLRKAQADLPIAEYRSSIIEALEKNQVVIVAGDTGCGKSTQVPQYLLQAGYSQIACTQPRRIACIALAKRVGFETLNEFGSEIGYQIRFERQKTDKTRVLFLTEGLLLRQISADEGLSGYNVIVLDEVHERHLHGDFLLGAIRCLMQKRPELKVILMSATININLFKNYFEGDAPVIQVPGRLYPIKLQYHPIPAIEQSSKTDKLNPAPYVRVLQLIDSKYPESERGDVLIFLSGIKEITTVADACKEYAEKNNKWIILLLHSTLSLTDQDKVFDYAPEGVRKCIVSTNIAETSVTIDGVRFVVDSGKHKEMQFDPICKIRRLKECWCSQASAEQRKGRAGRTGPGVCFRLFDAKEFEAMDPYSTPEIHRVPLDDTVLQLISMGLPDARKFPFVEPPSPESIENSIIALKEVGAMKEDESLTIIGKTLANLPVDVNIGKMLIIGTLFHQVDSVLSLAAALSVQSPFTNNAYKDEDCIAARKDMDSNHGDPITLLNAYREWLEIKVDDQENSKRWCKKRGLEEQRFYEMTKLREQFKELLKHSSLLKDKSEDLRFMNSSERAKRHGELKHLKSMKKEYHKNEGSKRKKFLSMRDMEIEGIEGEDEKNGNRDIKDIEFRMKNDHQKMKDLLESSKAYSYKDLTLLKLILSSGLYPQMAIADEFNHAKGGPDQLFHTRVKPFNFLHPNSIFASNPNYVAIEDIDIIHVPGFNEKFPVSAKHQLLVYMSLLETNKPYVVNAIRMPALQTLLLFSRNIDTNCNFRRLVFDSWIEVKFADLEEGQNQFLKATLLRNTWEEFLALRLHDSLKKDTDPSTTESNDEYEKSEELETKLSRGLIEFINAETLFCMRRLLPGDLKIMYSHQQENNVTSDTNPFVPSSEFVVKENEHKGGVNLTDYLTYNCLENSAEEISSFCMQWQCPFCQETMYTSPLLRIGHYKNCCDTVEKEILSNSREQKELQRSKENPNAKKYLCEHETCKGKVYYLTSVQILKHKRQH